MFDHHQTTIVRNTFRIPISILESTSCMLQWNVTRFIRNIFAHRPWLGRHRPSRCVCLGLEDRGCLLQLKNVEERGLRAWKRRRKSVLQSARANGEWMRRPRGAFTETWVCFRFLYKTDGGSNGPIMVSISQQHYLPEPVD